jgi:cathepsin E
MVALAMAAAASPFVVREGRVSLQFAKHINITGPQHLLQHDQQRAAALRSHANRKLDHRAVVSTPATNAAVSYLANVGVGTPATTCALDPFVATSGRRELIACRLSHHRYW